MSTVVHSLVAASPSSSKSRLQIGLVVAPGPEASKTRPPRTDENDGCALLLVADQLPWTSERVCAELMNAGLSRECAQKLLDQQVDDEALLTFLHLEDECSALVQYHFACSPKDAALITDLIRCKLMPAKKDADIVVHNPALCVSLLPGPGEKTNADDAADPRKEEEDMIDQNDSGADDDDADDHNGPDRLARDPNPTTIDSQTPGTNVGSSQRFQTKAVRRPSRKRLSIQSRNSSSSSFTLLSSRDADPGATAVSLSANETPSPHPVLRIEQPSDGAPSYFAAPCSTHPANRVEFFCDHPRCQVPVCSRCITSSHSYHIIIPLREVEGRLRSTISEKAAKLSEKVSDLPGLEGELNSLDDPLESNFVSAKASIDQFFEELHAQVDEAKEHCLNSLAESRLKRKKNIADVRDKFAHLKNEASILFQEIRAVTDSLTPGLIVDEFKGLHTRLQDLIKSPMWSSSIPQASNSTDAMVHFDRGAKRKSILSLQNLALIDPSNIEGPIKFRKQEEIRKKLVNDCLYNVKGLDAGRNAWYYVLVERNKLPFFLKALNDDIIQLAEYGCIVRSAYGDSPPESVTKSIKEEYFIQDGSSTFQGTQNLFFLGGEESKATTDLFEYYDPVFSQWRPMPAMPTPRRGFAYALHEGCIYVAGGNITEPKAGMRVGSVKERLRSAECFDLRTMQWSSLPALKEIRSGASGVVLPDKSGFLLTGGFDGEKELKTCELFDFATREWQPFPSLGIERSSHTSIVYQGKVVILGGYFDKCTLVNCEQYNPESRSWEPFPDLILPGTSFQAYVIKDHIYLTAEDSATAEVFDGEKWHELPIAAASRRERGACITFSYPF